MMDNRNWHLPEGYQVVTRGGEHVLLNPRGDVILMKADTPASASDLEESAWNDAWREIERSVRREMIELRAGLRAADDVERLPQYHRLLEAVQATPEERRDTPRRLRRLSVGAVGSFALFLAGAALMLLARNLSSIIRLHQP